MNPIDTLFTIHLFGLMDIAVSWLTFFGLTGNVLFSGRVLIQWIASEKRRRSVVPAAFWWISLVAAAIQIVYALMHHDAAGRHDPDLPMLLGLSVTILPYWRNLRIHYHPDRPPRAGAQILLPAFALLAVVVYGAATGLPHQNWWIFGLGLAGNAIYCSRFIVAWVRAESERRAILPLSFWYISMVGSVILLVYSLLRGDLVFILSFLFNTIPYARNILLIRRERRAAAAT